MPSPTGLVVKNGWNSFASSSRRHARAGVLHLEPDVVAVVARADGQMRPVGRAARCSDCSALMTKFSTTCCSSVNTACVGLRRPVVDVRARCPARETGAGAARRPTRRRRAGRRCAGDALCCRLNRERLRMIALARALSFLMSARSSCARRSQARDRAAAARQTRRSSAADCSARARCRTAARRSRRAVPAG